MTVLRVSSVPHVLQRLVQVYATALVGEAVAPSGGDIPVYWGDPGPTADRECLIIGDTSTTPAGPTGQKWAAIGARKREEEYLLAQEVLAWMPGQSASEAVFRAYEIVGLCETVLRTDVTAGLMQDGTLEWIELQVNAVTHRTWPAKEGHVAYVLWATKVMTRI